MLTVQDISRIGESANQGEGRDKLKHMALPIRLRMLERKEQGCWGKQKGRL